MAYHERRPGVPALTPWAPCAWVRVAGADPALVTPDGCVDLYWADGRLVVAGPDTGARLAGYPAGTVIAGLRLRAGTAPLLLGDVPAGEIRDAQPALADLWTAASAEALATRLGAAEGWAAAGVLELAVAARLPGFTPDPAVLRAVRALDRPRPPALGTLARDLGLSDRQLRRRFTDAVGYGPRTLHGVLRFRRATAAARAGMPWPEVAARTGFSDQPHLAREVRRWSGHTPTELIPG